MALEGFFNVDNSGNEVVTPEALARRRKLADALIGKGQADTPITSWTQGLSKLIDTGVGSYKAAQLDKQEAEARKASADSFNRLLPAFGVGDASGATAAPVSGASGAGSAATTNAASAAPVGGFDAAVNRTLGFEGGLNPADTNGTPSKFGINQQANPGVDLATLDQDGAKGIYKAKYWDAIGGDKLPAPLAHVAFDTAVIAGPGKAQQLIAQSGGDPMKLLDLREQFQNNLLARDPDKYGKYAPAWNNRLAALRADVSNTAANGAPADPNAPPASIRDTMAGVVSRYPQIASTDASFTPSAPAGTMRSTMEDTYTKTAQGDPAARAISSATAGDVNGDTPRLAFTSGGAKTPGQVVLDKYMSQGGAPGAAQGLQGQPSPQMGVLQNTPPAGAPSQIGGPPAQGGMGVPASAAASATAGNPGAQGTLPAPQRTPNIISALAQALTDPWASDGQRQLALTLARDKMGAQVSTVDLGNSIGVMDRSGNLVRTIPKQKDPSYGFVQAQDGTMIRTDSVGGTAQPVYQGAKPTYGVIGEDQYGNKQMGWIDPTTRTVVPGPGQGPSQRQMDAAAPNSMGPGTGDPNAATMGAPAIPPPPPGVDPKLWRAEQTKLLANGGPKMTQDEANANAFASRMEESNKVLSQHEDEGLSVRNTAAGYVPILGNKLVGENAQLYNQAKRQFVNSVLRKESGASISDSEFKSAEAQYFPQPGDGSKVVEQKRQARETAIAGMRAAAGRPRPPQPGAQPAPNGAAPSPAPNAPPSREEIEAEMRRRGLM